MSIVEQLLATSGGGQGGPVKAEAAAEITRLRADLEKAKEMLLACAICFEDYAAKHRDKGTPEGEQKARANAEKAEAVRSVLTTLDASGQDREGE